MFSKIVVITAMLAGILGSPTPDYIGNRFSPQDYRPEVAPFAPVDPYGGGNYGANPSYSFNYGVQDNGGNNYGHQETRDGYLTQGSYHVDLPDGRRQIVSYYVDKDSGYVANVRYEGEAIYPETPHQPYRPPYQPNQIHQQPIGGGAYP